LVRSAFWEKNQLSRRKIAHKKAKTHLFFCVFNGSSLMSSSSLTLESFIQYVPALVSTANMTTAVTTLQKQPSEILALIDAEGLPVGIVRSYLLLAQIGKTLTEKSKISSLANFDLKALMEPLTVFPVKMKVKELRSRLQNSKKEALRSLYGVVDPEGKFLGLLDGDRLLKKLADDEREEKLEKEQTLPSVMEELLFDLLEKLPLPMMVYASGGRILHRNSDWRKHIGEFFPIEEGSFCPLVLEPIAFNEPQEALAAAIHNRQRSLKDERPSVVRHKGDRSPEVSKLHPSLEARETVVSNAPEVLGCPKTLGDRAWQFVKLPLNGSEPQSAGDGDILANRLRAPWIVIATDVTEQQKLCRELAAKNADLAQLNRLKDEFLACISHELKSPLTAVLGLSSLLKEKKLGELNQRQIHYAQLIYQSGRQLMSLVNDLLDLTRLETGQLKLNPFPVSIQAICEQAYLVVEEKYLDKSDKTISFTLEIEAGLEKVVADELRLRQILVHLLDNAVKFTPMGQPVGIKVSRWQDWIALTVWDTGIGIPEEYQHLIFQKFQQLESPLTRQFEGTGLGLFLTQRLARAHGGEISFISKVGEGSQFTLLLPPSQSASLSEESKGLKRYPLVLAIEAHPPAIDRIAETLTQLDYRVAIARTGTEALEKARQLRPQMIFLNPLLPLLSGWDVLTLLKSDPQTKSIPIVVTANQSDRQKSQQCGADGFLSLPVERERLKEILGKKSERAQVASKPLKILHLYRDAPSASSDALQKNYTSDLTAILGSSPLNYRILEADDLEQAEMLARVWKTDVIVLEGKEIEDPEAYLRSLSLYSMLSSLPLVTLESQLTQAANKIGNLAVFPCLSTTDKKNGDRLLQVIQIANETGKKPK
jgi:signal transduction histidine kinase/ActR/RegA family two-component response regulator